MTQKPPPPLRVALLGAAGTGTSRLAAELRSTSLGHLVLHDQPMLAGLSGLAAGLPPAWDHVLLMGLDLPQAPGELAPQQADDTRLRALLAGAALPFTVIYGLGPERLARALVALRGVAAAQAAGTQAADRPWLATCDHCSDPACERRLLSDLIASRTR